MDPWLEINDKETSETTLDVFTSFEDNFTNQNSTEFNKLPDSDQYLAILESKLERIKNDPNILSQLSKKREACINQLLQSDQQYKEDSELDENINPSSVLKFIAPQKIGLNQGEIVDFIQYDQLKTEDENEQC